MTGTWPEEAPAAPGSGAGTGGARRRRRRPEDPRIKRRRARLDAAAEAVIALALVSAPLMLGSAPTWAVAVGFGLAVLLLGLLVGSGRLRRAADVPWVGWGLIGVAAFEALQLVPLPPFLVGWLAPRTAEVAAFVLGDLGGWPAWRPLSLDPVQTGLEWVRHLTAVAVFLAVSALAGRPERRHRLTVILVLSGVAVVTVALGQRLLGLERIYGLHPRPAQGWLFAAFVNPNHFAAYLDLLAPAALGLALGTRDRSKAALWGVAFVLLGGAALLTLSRGGIVALLAGLTVFAALRGLRGAGKPAAGVRPPRARLPAAVRALAAPVLVGGALSVAAWLAWEPIVSELSTLTDEERMKDEARWAVWRDAAGLVGDHWAFGTGRGAFAVAFPMHRTTPGQITFEHAENQVVEAVAELGVPVGLAFAALLAAAWLAAARRRAPSPRELGLLAGLFALGVHELADFSTAHGGVALPALAALALLGSHRKTSGGRAPPWPAAALVGVAVLAGAFLLVRGWDRRADQDVARLAEALAAGAPVEETVRPVLLRRPSDHMPPLMAGSELLRRGAEPARALAWINRAMYLSPTESRGHLLAAELLARLGRKTQALLEYRLAIELRHPAADVIRRAAARYPALEDLAQAVPDRPADRLALARHLRGAGRHEDTWALLSGDEATEGDPDPALLAARAAAASAVGRHEEAESLGRALIHLDPRSPEGWLAVARARLSRDDADGAASLLREGLAQLPGDPALSLALVPVELDRRKNPEAALAALRAMRLPAAPWQRARMHHLSGRARLAAGQTRRALEEFGIAARITPRDPWPLVSLGDALAEGQQFERALEAYEEALARAPGHAAIEARATGVREKVEALETFRKRQMLYGTGDVELPVPP